MKNYSTKCMNICRTTALYFSFFALGLCTAIPGPTLLDLEQIVKTDTGQVAFIYLARSSGYLAGSLIGGILFDCMKRKQLLLILCNLVMSISALLTPWSRNIETLISLLAVGGLSMGALDTGGNVLCLDIWGKDSAPYFQALHFLFGVGAFLAPLIAEPFLSVQCTENITETVSYSVNESLWNPEQHLHVTANFSSPKSITGLPCSSDIIPPVTYSYSIIGSFGLFVTLLFVVLFFIFPDEDTLKSSTSYEKPVTHGVVFTVIVSLIAQIVLSLYCGIEIGYGQMIAIFAVKSDLKLSKSFGSFITSVYWGTFTFSRGISIFLSYRFSPFSLVFCDILIMILGCAILLVFGTTYVECLWVGTVFLALGLASFYPSVISWVERYINVSNRIASFFVVAASVGEMVIPLTVSQYIDTKPHMLLNIIVGCIGGVILFVFILWLVTSQKGEKYGESKRKDTNVSEEEETTL